MFKSGCTPWNKGQLNPLCAPTQSPTTKDICWAAGIFEGEGYCAAAYGLDSRGATATVSQRDRWILDRLRVLFGGRVKPIKTKQLTKAGESRNYFRWDLTGARARGFLMTIYSLLSPRRQSQALAVFNPDFQKANG